MAEKSIPTQKDFKDLTDFLPIFSKPGFDPFLKPSNNNLKVQGVIVFRPAEYTPEVIEFFNLLSQDFWMDHDYIPENTYEILNNNLLVNSASFATMRSLLIYCQRGERFCDGHWGAMIKNGKISLILERLAEIAKDFE